MSHIRRYYVPNAVVFITQIVAHREPVFRSADHVALFRTVLRSVKCLHPFTMVAYVILPDHIHLLFRPHTETTFSTIMHSLKVNYTRQYKECMGIKDSMHFWQRGFWDHIIRDEADLQQHMDYIHFNPVAHGFVDRPEQWPHSSYVAWQQRGAYPVRWGWSLPDTLKDVQHNIRE